MQIKKRDNTPAFLHYLRTQYRRPNAPRFNVHLFTGWLPKVNGDLVYYYIKRKYKLCQEILTFSPVM